MMTNPIAALKYMLFVLATFIPVALQAQNTEAENLYKKGVEYQNQRQYDQAVQSYTEAIKLNPRYIQAYENRGTCYYMQSKNDLGMSNYMTAINIEPGNASLYFGLGRANYGMRKYSEAIANFNMCLKLNYPNLASIHNWIGYSYYLKGSHNDAVKSYEQAIRISPSFSQPYSNLALILFEGTHYDEALVKLNEAIHLDPKNYEAYYRRAEVYYWQERFDLAVKDYAVMVNQYPNSQKYYFKRGNAYEKIGARTLAIADYNKGLSITPDVNAYISRAELYEKLNENQLALADFAEAIRLSPNRRSTYTSRARFYKRTNQFQLAELDYSKSLNLDSDNDDAYYGRALLNKAKGDYKAAIKDFENAIRISPRYQEAYLGIVAPLVRTGAFEKAKEHIEKVNQLYSSTLLDNKGWRFYKYYFAAITDDLPTNQYESALANLDKGIEGYKDASNTLERFQPDFMSDILALKGMLLDRLSRFYEAGKAYEEALIFNPIQPDVKAVLEKVATKNGIVGRKKASPVVVTYNDNIPPEIRILQPAITRGLKVVGSGKDLLVKGTATDKSGIRSVSVNGISAEVDENGGFTANVALTQGVNNVLVVAIDKQGNQGKAEFTTERSPDAVKKTEVPVIPVQNTELTNVGKYYALIIGVQGYDDPNIVDLDQPVIDASLLYQILNKGYTFEPGNIVLLKNPTRNTVFESLEDLSQKVTAADNLLIFFAGHGYWDATRQQGYWFPSDAKKTNRSSWITNGDVTDNIKSISSRHTLLITDACFAGSIFKSRNISFDAPKAIKNLYELPSRKAMTSGTLKEVPDKSVFIEYMVKRLTLNTEKYLSAAQLYSSFRDAVINNSSNGQVPQYGEIREVGDEGGDFIFIKK